MSSAKEGWHPADQREQQPPPPGHLPPTQSQPGRHSPSGMHRYQPPPPGQGNFYQGPPPPSQSAPQAAPQSQLPHLPSMSSGQPPYPLPSLQGNPQGPPQGHILDRPPHETRPPHSQISQLGSPPVPIGQQQPSGPAHLYAAANAATLQQQQPPAPPQDRLGPIPQPNNSQALPAISSHPLQSLAQLPQGGPPPPQPHQEAVATIVNAPAAGLVNIPIGGQASIPPSYRPLNVKDALSYLDQVKVQFADHPNVYNQFLDIMKDFKSQAIDTPGVIERVSTLFAGNPNLIQGFNTFLPPGYRIECSSDPSDPHSIRVTTPQGTTTATSGQPPSMHLQGAIPPGGQNNGAWRAQDAWGEPARFRFDGEGGGPQDQQPPRDQIRPGPVQGRPGHPMANQPAHLQQPQPLQPGLGQPAGSDTVNQLQNAVAAANGAGALAGGQIRPGAPNGPMGSVTNGPLTPGGDMKRGPVEFNHAISYVNKIKTRFSSQPEIYKNFLEILQTYQRESKPIQEVYSQVTQLFNAAPDLLEDFKQFLPESAAQARQKPEDHLRDMNGMAAAMPGGRGPPPQGHFAPPLAAPKDTGKRKRPTQPVLSNSRDSGMAPLPSNPLHDLNVGPSPGPRGAAANKRPKIMHKAAEAPVSPTLIPAPPTPLLPADPIGATGEEIAFFDRVRKYIGNKQTYNEFLKLLNLFSQDLMDKSLLVATLETFLGSNPELFNWIKRFLNVQDKTEDSVQNSLKKSQKVRLNVCRALGPSYRLLPKLEATKPCSGRDDMCRAVLNDEWASHPTWASEDSGFVGHKKNQYEEMLHRVEEERHDYDFHIEANLRTIQLLEPIAQRIATMTAEEKAAFRLSPGLGGQSRTIYQRCIKKVYREDGLETIRQLHEQPAFAVPIILRRLKQKDEEWRFAQREWNKVWREQTAKIFYKSLDHQGNTFKQNDKRNTTNRHFISEIDALYKVADSTQPDKAYHLKFNIPDLDVLLDICRLLSTQLDKEGAYSHGERQKIAAFIRNFIPTFFGIGKDEVETVMGSFSRKSPDEDVDMEHADSSSGRGSRKNKESNLLQDVLKRGRGGKSHKADNGSRGSTPELSNDDDGMDVDGHESEPVPPNAPATWINPSGPSRHSNGNDITSGAGIDARDIVVSELKERNAYSMFANSTIYCFMRLLQIVYQRLLDVKNCESVAKVTLERRKNNTTARKLGLVPQTYDEFFTITDEANYYQQVLDQCERLILGNVDSNVFEDGMRSVYIQKGWQLYTIDKHIASLNKTIQTFVGDSRDNSGEILKLFDRDRAEDKTNFQLQMSYRRDVEMFIGREEPTYRIEWNTDTKEISVQLLFRVDPTHTAKLSKDEKWSYYVDSYIMAQPTEGVDAPKRPPFLPRNLPSHDAIDSFSARDCQLGGTYSFKKPIIQEGLELKICVNTYKLYFTPGTTDVMIASGESRLKSVDAEKRSRAKRRKEFEAEWVNNTKKFKETPQEYRLLGCDGVEGLWKA